MVVTPPNSSVFVLPQTESAETWTAAIRRTNGDLFYISNRTEEAIVNNIDLYFFFTQNLYFFENASGTTYFLTYLIPGHAPKNVVWEEGQNVLVVTTNCVLRLWPDSLKVAVALGNCYETGLIRDGPPLFARFNNIVSVASVSVDSLVLVDTGNRICILKEGLVSSIYLNASIHAITTLYSAQDGSFWSVVSWDSGGGISIWRESNVGDVFRSGEFQRLAIGRISLLNLFLGKSSMGYLFALDESSMTVKRYKLILDSINETVSLYSLPGPMISMMVDFPSGLYMVDGRRRGVLHIPTLGCFCPPGYAIQNQGKMKCQPAPIGGYVDLFGQFNECPAGTYGDQTQGTAEEVCRPCPPLTISNESQSSMCTLCLDATLRPDPTKTMCVSECPIGTNGDAGGCSVCDAGYSGSGCMPCGANTFSDPSIGIYSCVTCPPNTTSIQGSSECFLVCGSGTCSPNGRGACLPLAWKENKGVVFTVAVTGFKAVDMAVARNGSVYIAGYQQLVVVDQGGNSMIISLSVLSLVRGIALSQDEGILYAVVTGEQVLCFTFVGIASRFQWTSKVFVPGAVLVGIRTFQQSSMLALWSLNTNSIMHFNLESSTIFSSDAQNLIVAMQTSSQTLVMLQHVALGNQSVIALPSNQVIARNTNSETAWNPYMVVWRGNLVLSSYNSIVANSIVAGARNLTGRVDSSALQDARFTAPGPMVAAPQENMLLVLDQNALRVLYDTSQECECSESFFLSDGGACVACPVGFMSMGGSQTCTSCTEGQYNDLTSGGCVPCPRAQWWASEKKPCSAFIDTMVGVDSVGLSLSDILSELAAASASVLILESLMLRKDYVSMQTLVLPIASNAMFLDAAAQSRFWIRSQRITPPPVIYVSTQPNAPLHLVLPLELPGFWIECSQYVLQIETCSCDLPAGNLLVCFYAVCFCFMLMPCAFALCFCS